MEKEYVEFAGKSYYIDFETLTNLIKLEYENDVEYDEKITKNINERTGEETKTIEKFTPIKRLEIDVSKYETYRYLLDMVFSFDEEFGDDTLGSARALNKTSLGFKIAFNTLLNYGVIKEIEQ